MKKNTLFSCLLAFLTVCALSTNAQWQTVNQSFVSTVNCIAASGTTVFAGTENNGMFRSTDSGTTWSGVNSGLANHSIYAVAISGNKIFAGTWGGGAYLSSNNGNSWTQINNGLTASYISGFAINGSYIIAATGEGTFLSKDAGTSWMPADSGLVSPYYMISIIQSGTNLFIGDYFGGVYLSVDSGKHWNVTGIAADEIYSFATIGSNVFGGTYTNGGGIFLTKDSGANWTAIDSGLTYKGVHSLATSESNILAGTDTGGVFLSVNGGNIWADFNTGGLNGNHIFSLTVNLSYIFAGTKDGHIWKRPTTDIINCTPVITTSNYSICQGSTATLTASNGSGWLWNTGDTTQSIVATTTGVYSCAITTDCGVLTSNAINIVVKPLPVASITASGPTTFCKGGNDTLKASAGTAYLWSNGKTTSSIFVNTSNTYSVIILGANGCTSTASVNVASIPFAAITSQPKNDTVFANCLSAQFSVGDTVPNLSYQWQVNVGSGFGNLSNVGIYSGVVTDTLMISNAIAAMSGYSYRCILSNSGCPDTSASAQLIIKSAKTASQTDTLCAGDSITVGTNIHSTSGTYKDTLKAAGGCDSLYITTHLVIDSIIKHSQTVKLCAGLSLTVGIHTYDTAGTFIDTIQNGKGCDSIVTTHLTINPAIRDSISITLCAGDSLSLGSHVYSTSGSYTDSSTTTGGCDSLTIVNLVIDSMINHSQTITLCKGQSFTVGMHTHDTAGTFIDTIQNGKGCDSIVTTHLAFNTISSSQTFTLCGENSVTVGIHTYDTTGVFIDTLSNGMGCDSIVTTHLSFVNDITLKGDTLKASTSPAIYQWFNCADMDSILAITQSFIPQVNGDYAAVITVNGCSETSLCTTVSTAVGIKVNMLDYSVILYPNPATNMLNIHTSSLRTNEMAIVSVMNVMGEIMQTEKLKWSSDVSININNLPAGMYFLQMNSEGRSITKRFIKE